MHALLLTLHSLVRWLVILLGLAAVARSVSGLSGGRSWVAADEKPGRLFAVSLDIQMLVGLLLHLFVSPITTSAFGDMGSAMSNSATRFWLVEHPVMMLAALAVAHIGVARVRKGGSPEQKRRRALILFGIALLLVLAATPWPFMSTGRPLFRLG